MRFLISQSDLQCFSHEDGCFTTKTNSKNRLSELVFHVEPSLNRELHTLRTSDISCKHIWFDRTDHAHFH